MRKIFKASHEKSIMEQYNNIKKLRITSFLGDIQGK